MSDIPDGAILFVNQREYPTLKGRWPNNVVAPHYNVPRGSMWVLTPDGKRVTRPLDWGGGEDVCGACGQALPPGGNGQSASGHRDEGAGEGED